MNVFDHQTTHLKGTSVRKKVLRSPVTEIPRLLIKPFLNHLGGLSLGLLHLSFAQYLGSMRRPNIQTPQDTQSLTMQPSLENSHGRTSPQCLSLQALPIYFRYGRECGIIRRKFRENNLPHHDTFLRLIFCIILCAESTKSNVCVIKTRILPFLITLIFAEMLKSMQVSIMVLQI